MATLTVQNIASTGTAITLASAAGGGDSFINDASGRTFFMVTNGGGGSITVTFDAVPTSVVTATYGTIAVSDMAVAVAAGATKMIGPFKQALYNQADGMIDVTYSGVSSVTVAAIKLGDA